MNNLPENLLDVALNLKFLSGMFRMNGLDAMAEMAEIELEKVKREYLATNALSEELKSFNRSTNKAELAMCTTIGAVAIFLTLIV